ncbi:MAG: AAA family ATPase [Pseudomonadota bacterium]
MYLSHFGLNQSPFGITPNPVFFYTGNQRGAILDALMYAVVNGEGIIKVTGEVGSGKTMLCRMLESMLPSNVVPIYLVNPTLSRDEVLYAIAGELGLDTSDKRAADVIRDVQNDLIAKHIEGKQVVLLIEEAQAMSLETLEEIRLFSNLETAHHKLLQIVLFGQPELDENLRLPQMRQLKERITHSFKVPPLMPTLLPDFLMFRMRAAGYHGPDIFTKAAIRLLAAVSEGVVRRVSILADKSLLAAFADNTHTIKAKHVKAAIDDSEFSHSTRLYRRRLWKPIAALTLLTVLGLLGWLAIQYNQNHPPPAPLTISSQTVPSPDNPSVRAVAAPSAAMVDEVTAATSEAPRPEAIPAAGIHLYPIHQYLSKAWLNAQASRLFSIQIALIDNDPVQINAFLRKAKEEMRLENIHFYPTRSGKIVRLGVLYSVYTTRAEALSMKTRLADEWGYQPRLRTIAGIKAEVLHTQSDDLWPKAEDVVRIGEIQKQH